MRRMWEDKAVPSAAGATRPGGASQTGPLPRPTPEVYLKAAANLVREDKPNFRRHALT